MDNDKGYLEDYRRHLLDLYQKSQEDYDKTVLSLSSGALGISFAFVKDIVGSNPIVESSILYWAWICWGASVACVLVSHLTSSLSLRKAIQQVDNKDVHAKRVGGLYDIITSFLNPMGGLLFLSGLILIILFVKRNLV